MSDADGELRRRLVHASGAGLPALYLVDAVDWPTLRLLFVLFAAVALALEAVRLTVGLDWAVYDHLTREYERENPAGYALYAVSSAGVVLVAPPVAAVPGVLMLALGDPVGGLLGSAGVEEWKSPGVVAATFGVCFLLAVPFTLPVAGVRVGALAAATGAAGAAVADGYKPRVAGYVVDDNATIAPLGAGGIGVVLALAG